MVQASLRALTALSIQKESIALIVDGNKRVILILIDMFAGLSSKFLYKYVLSKCPPPPPPPIY